MNTVLAGFPESKYEKDPNGVLIPEKGKESTPKGMNVVTIIQAE